MAGPSVTEETMEGILERQARAEEEEEKRNQQIAQAVALNPNLRPEDLYGQEIPQELLQEPEVQYIPVNPQMLMAMMGQLGGGLPLQLRQIIYDNLQGYFQQNLLTDENIQLLAQQINTTYPGYGLNNIIDEINYLLPEVISS